MHTAHCTCVLCSTARTPQWPSIARERAECNRMAYRINRNMLHTAHCTAVHFLFLHSAFIARSHWLLKLNIVWSTRFRFEWFFLFVPFQLVASYLSVALSIRARALHHCIWHQFCHGKHALSAIFGWGMVCALFRLDCCHWKGGACLPTCIFPQLFRRRCKAREITSVKSLRCVDGI